MTAPCAALLFTNFVPPYREEVYRHASALLGGGLTVCTLSRMEKNRAWPETRSHGFTSLTLPGVQTFVHRFQLPVHLNFGVARVIAEASPAVVVVDGYDAPAYWRAQQLCRRQRRPFAFWSGSTASSGLVRNGIATVLRRRFVAGCDAYLAYGTLAARFLVELGAPRARVVTSANAVDTSAFSEGIPHREETRRAMGWSGRKVVMYSGRLIPQKGVDVLIRAVARCAGDPLLAIVGDGRDRADDERLAHRLLGGRAEFLGSRGYSELPRLYAAADVFVLPSRNEVWGLVVNEALAAGVPVIATDATGAAHDLVAPTGAGLVIRYGDEVALAAALEHVLGDDDARARMGAAGRAAVASRDCAAYARDFVRAVGLAASSRKARS